MPHLFYLREVGKKKTTFIVELYISWQWIHWKKSFHVVMRRNLREEDLTCLNFSDLLFCFFLFIYLINWSIFDTTIQCMHGLNCYHTRDLLVCKYTNISIWVLDYAPQNLPIYSRTIDCDCGVREWSLCLVANNFGLLIVN